MECTNQVAEFKYITLIGNMLTKHLDKALDVARGRMEYKIL